MSLSEVNELQISPRKRIHPGMTVRLAGGGELGLRGVFKVRKILKEFRQRHERYFLDVVDAAGRYATVFVVGKSYRRHGQTWQPQKVLAQANH